MALTLNNPVICPAGTNTANFSRALKVTSFVVGAASATAVSAQVTDLNGNVLYAGAQPATIGFSSTEMQSPIILPGGSNLAVDNWIVTVTGTGGSLYIYHR